MTTVVVLDMMRDAVHEFVRGLRDFFFGVLSISVLDSNRTDSDGSISQMVVNDIQSFTVLALRREKQREAKRKANTTGDANTNAHRPKLFQRLIQCILLNGGVFLFSLLFFHYALLPGLQYSLSTLFRSHSQTIWVWLRPLLSYTFGLFWVMPVFVLSRIVNCFWFQDIADQAFRLLGLKPAHSLFKNLLGDLLFSSIVQLIFLIQSQAISQLPIYPLGRIFGFLHMSLLNSYYTFEYRWFNMGYSFYKRMDWMEFNWPYYTGFGLPLTAITYIPESRLVGGCLFAILFPLLIVAGHIVDPPTGKTTYRIPFFRPSVFIANTIFLRFLNGLVSSQQRLQNTKQP
ncbi:etoposide-induced protein 2.4-like [Tropilaelaps mercedesae]|uniref:Etoposide-induced protein 2.4-like n=1 Tax=Tropilaelaps mercedesae TaxID=418985 RepID=A0A1V9XSD6_9ACAR|nr:etoposide-induced protein 2.4-like [Tropilaelaps mercedesae]